MTRKKVQLAFIANDTARKATYKKRKKGLMKKVGELSTLCGIDACTIMYSPYETQPECWPDTHGVQRVLAQFKRMPEMEQSKKMENQESFIRQRIVKASEQLKKQAKDNREKEITEVMYQCLTGNGLDNLVVSDLNALGWLINQNLEEIYKRIDVLKKSSSAGQHVAEHAWPPPAAASNLLGQEQKPPAVDLPTDPMADMQRPQWFMDWVNNPSDQRMAAFGHAGEEMISQLKNNHHNNAMWSNPLFP